MDLLRDIRFAGRLLVKNRWFTVMAVVVLALGIGANNAVFTIVNGVLLRNLPVAQPEEIMFLGTRDTQGRNQGVSLRDFEDWKAATRTFAGMSFLFNGAFNVGNEGLTPDQIPGAYVSPNLFKMLGVSPALGRDFTPAEDTPGTPIVVLISNTVWRQRYGGDPNIVGKPIRIIDQGGTIIGVMPEGMDDRGNVPLIATSETSFTGLYGLGVEFIEGGAGGLFVKHVSGNYRFGRK